MLELEMLFAPKKKDLDLFDEESILETEKKTELCSKILYKWMDEDIRLRKRKSI